MKNLVLLQIFAFLFISPLIITFTGGSTDYRLGLSVLLLLSFVAGLALAKYRSPLNTLRRAASFPVMTTWLKLSLIILTAAYISVVVSNELMVRRQGSEVMAEIFANLPVFQLLVLRVYEVIFYPVLIAVLVGMRRDRSATTKLLLLGFFVGFAFTGVLDSRAKLITPLLFYYVIFIASKSSWRPVPSKFLVMGGVFLGLMAFSIGLDRSSDFDRVSEYFFEDVLRRLDGLELISIVDGVVNIPLFGTLDTHIFANFLAGIPFYEGAAALKEAGLTSSKSYLLQVVLGFDQFDINNSVVTDLYYFGGYPLLIAGSCLYGYLVMAFDLAVRSNDICRNRRRMAFMLSFLVNALRIEQDYFSIALSTFRDFLILYFLFYGFRFYLPARVAPR